MTLSSERYHAFDALRATMMLLGIVLHAGVNYMIFDLGDAWPYQDRATSLVATGLVGFIHAFRMPVFFVMAGFFAALVMQRRGLAGMIRNRLARVALPFALFWVVLLPAIGAGVAYANGAKTGAGGAAVRAWLDAGIFWTDDTWHFWFLLYLTVFYAVAALAAPLARLITPESRATLSRAFVRLIDSPARAFVLAVPTAIVIFLQGGLLEADRSFTPEPTVLLGHGIYFAVGWALWHHQTVIERLTRRAWTQVLVALLISPAVGATGGALAAGASLTVIAAGAAAGGVVVWLFVFGITGLTIRWARHERPWVRYLTDASYWMYLVHVPLMFWLPGLLANVALPGLAKLTIVLATATPILLASYHWFVRPTFIGVLLNGRRYPIRRVIAGDAPVTAQAA